jgi:4-hydroxybenzoate polyprenyltransferase
MMAWLSVLGFPAAIYVASITALFVHMLGQKFDPWAVFGSGMLAMGVYIFHRSSVQECADMQQRHRISIAHRKPLRYFSAVAVTISLIVLAVFHPVAPVLILCAFGGVVLYGRHTWIVPIRNIMLLKPPAVGASIAVLAWVLSGMPADVILVVAFAMICSADALLCDLDDRAYDQATGCTTMATLLGTQHSWIVAGVAYAFGCGLLLLYLHSGVGLILLIAFPLPAATMGGGLRTAIDLRPLLVLLVAWLI